MKKYTYIRVDSPGCVELDSALDKNHKVGQLWADYNLGAWLLLTDAQVAFRDAHPNASKKEVFDMQLTPLPVRTLKQAIWEKIAEIDRYDNSDAVNSFLFAGQSCWINAQERATYNASIQAAELLGESEIEIPIAGQFIVMSVVNAKGFLALIQRYADKAAIVTGKHKYAVSQLTSIEEVDAYDYTVNYPEKVIL
jgi:hypothetical protein